MSSDLLLISSEDQTCVNDCSGLRVHCLLCVDSVTVGVFKFIDQFLTDYQCIQY